MTLCIAGAGALGREVLDVAVACGRYREVVFCDDALAGQTVRGVPVRHPDEVADAEFVVGVADPSARRSLAGRLRDRGLGARALVHPAATVAPDTVLGAGCVILAGAVVSSSCLLGVHTQVHYNATVGHDAVLDAYSTVFPGANVGGACHLGADAAVGANATVLQQRSVGAGAFVGAGAVATRDIPAGAIAVGVPARPRR